MNAPANTSNRGTSCETSTSTAVGHPARTTPFMAATKGEPEPKSVVKVTTGGAISPLPVPCLFPGVCFVVIATLLPETEPVPLHELYAAPPLRPLPEIFRGHGGP